MICGILEPIFTCNAIMIEQKYICPSNSYFPMVTWPPLRHCRLPVFVLAITWYLSYPWLCLCLVNDDMITTKLVTVFVVWSSDYVMMTNLLQCQFWCCWSCDNYLITIVVIITLVCSSTHSHLLCSSRMPLNYELFTAGNSHTATTLCGV